MRSLRNLTGALCPAAVTEILEAKRALAPVSSQPWKDAFSSTKRIAIGRSRLSILPLRFLSSPQFVVDVGTNQGQWISSLLDLVPVRKVWVFEPNPEAMKICRERLKNHEGIRYFDQALGDTNGQITLHMTASSDFTSVLRPKDEFLKQHYGNIAARVIEDRQVQMCTLDSLVPETAVVDLLKIDVQGFERAVLTGARRVLKNTRAVLIEANLQSHYVGDDTFPVVWTLLASQGFLLWNFSPPFLGQHGEALWTDAVFVKTGANDDLRA
jgi:FkbM family methyltransferase